LGIAEKLSNMGTSPVKTRAMAQELTANTEPETLKLPEEYIGKTLEVIGIANDYLSRISTT
jgi:hypothetical protein